MQRLSVNRDDPLYTYAISFMERAWKVKGFFPGAQPVSIEYRHFDILSSNEYLVCEKTDGLRFMLLAFMYNNKKTCVLINRALDVYTCPLNFRKPIYDGTIIEGELYKDTFMAYDCMMVRGSKIGENDMIDRLKHMEELQKMLTVLKYDPIKFKIKTFHVMAEFEKFMNEYLPTVEQEIDGLIFTPVKDPVQKGTHETMFKWKPKDKNTIDFQFKRKGDTWKLYVQERGKLMFESEIHTYQVPEHIDVQEDSIIECQYMLNDSPMWWKPIMRRHDKTFPNSRRTFYRTLVNIKEGIIMSDFLKCT